MIELEGAAVAGFKSLETIPEIPVRKPTIVTGVNDGGKSTFLVALGFLLGGSAPDPSEFTFSIADPTDPEVGEHAEEIVVTGSFVIGADEQAEFSIGPELALRRVAERSGGSRYEMRTLVPSDQRLRDIDSLGLAQLKELAEELGIDPVGAANRKASFVEPLGNLAQAGEWVEDWVAAHADIVSRVPLFLMFSSTDEPDAEAQIKSALRTAFEKMMQDPDFVEPVRQAETLAREELAKNAEQLCAHVVARCEEIETLSVVPEVSFVEGLKGVKIKAAAAAGPAIELDAGGAGKRRRVNLAIWEWAGDLLGQPDGDRAVVIAYDEPDTHLDYGNQRDLVSMIHSQCAVSRVRVVVATHSLNLIDRVDIGSVVHFSSERERTVVNMLVSEDHDTVQKYLSEIAESMGLRNSVLIHERCFCCVEGPTEKQALPGLFKIYTGMTLQSAGVALLSGDSNVGALKVIEFLKANNRKLSFLLIDKDTQGQKTFNQEALRRVGVADDEISFVGEKELEDLFTDDQWADTANRAWPRVDGAEWTRANFEALRSEDKFSDALLEAVRTASEEAPNGKPGLLVELVHGLRNPEDVPVELQVVFNSLLDLAA